MWKMTKLKLMNTVNTHLKQFVLNRLSSITLNHRVKKVLDFYEDFIGIKEIRKTQEQLLQVEAEFVESTKSRREAQDRLISMQQQLKQVRQKLDSTHRGEEAYLQLITNEHQLIKSEMQFINNLHSLEEIERDLFTRFSRKLRDAHEVERMRQEKTKYLSIIGSVVGAVLGIIATSINHALKMSDVRQLVKIIETQNLVNSKPETTVLTSTSDNVKSYQVAQSQTEPFQNENQIVQIITTTESNLEYKMKINSLTTVIATYALLAVTLPIIIKFLTD